MLAASSQKSELSGNESTELVGLLVRLATGNAGVVVELAEASAGWAFNKLTTLVLNRVSGEGLNVCFLDEREPVRFASMLECIGG